MTTLALIQARLSSSRLPGKVLADIGGRPMILHVVERVRAAATVDRVVVVTSDRADDDPLAALLARCALPYFRGSLEDVLDRYYRAACHYGGETIVRITGDCPLIDPAVIDTVVRAHHASGADYTTNTLRYTYPDGLDVEVFSFAALERAHREARKPSEREHVTPYLRNPERFRVKNVEHAVDLSPRQLRWCVDSADDLTFVRAVYARLGGRPLFGLNEVLALLEREPHLLSLQATTVSNEGYYRSLYREAELSAGRFPLPRRLVRAEGPYVIDEQGVAYLDYNQSLGPAAIDFARAEELKWLGRRLNDGLRALAFEAGFGDRLTVSGHPLAAVLHFRAEDGAEDLLFAAQFSQAAARHGVIVRGRHFLTKWHDYQAIEATLAAYAGVLKWLAARHRASGRGRRREGAGVRRAQ
ncbi:MAG: NTP transferase domain-containing protein [Chloroflexota bacterium]|nr:NTP transferase domain-containing protein [Dehalococcoidia bacterium]MDW8252942.1 NTP transferase domain-containing protein [Chloroflexota bacterium]